MFFNCSSRFQGQFWSGSENLNVSSLATHSNLDKWNKNTSHTHLFGLPQVSQALPSETRCLILDSARNHSGSL